MGEEEKMHKYSYYIEIWKQITFYTGGALYLLLILIISCYFILFTVLNSPVAFMNEIFGSIYVSWKAFNVILGFVLIAKDDYFLWEPWSYYYWIANWINVAINAMLASILLVLYILALPGGGDDFGLSSLFFQILLALCIDFGILYGLIALMKIMYITTYQGQSYVKIKHQPNQSYFLIGKQNLHEDYHFSKEVIQNERKNDDGFRKAEIVDFLESGKVEKGRKYVF
jgi:hypothetical protein